MIIFGKTLAEVKERYRIITNGERFRVQRRNLFGMWTDCPIAGNYMDALGFGFNSIGEYRSQEDAQAALDDLSGQEFAAVQSKNGWKPVEDFEASPVQPCSYQEIEAIANLMPLEEGNSADIAISDPPCRYCKHWNPLVSRLDHFDHRNIRLCWAKEMLQDFSCFEKKD